MFQHNIFCRNLKRNVGVFTVSFFTPNIFQYEKYWHNDTLNMFCIIFSVIILFEHMIPFSNLSPDIFQGECSGHLSL